MRWVLPAALLLGGCAQHFAMEPITDLGDRSCETTPNLSGATPLPVDPRGSRTVTQEFDPLAPCLRLRGERAGLYAAFRLPAERGATVLSVSSLPAGRTLLAPRVLLSDAAGAATREIGPDQFLFRGAGLAALVRLRPEEVHVVVGSAPALAGEPIERLQAQMHTTAVPIGVGVIFIAHGSEATQQMRFSHNGRVVLETRPALDTTVGP